MTQRDYYRLCAFFNNAEEKNVDIEGTENDRARYEQAQAEYHAKKKWLETRQKLIGEMRRFESFAEWRASVNETKQELLKWLTLFDVLPALDDEAATAELWASLEARADDTKQAIRQLSVDQRHLPKPYIMRLAEADKNRRKTHVLERGDFKRKGEEVFATAPELLSAFKPRGNTADRLDLAHWIASRANPLTARVAVNHVWRQLFGTGLVATADDFGTQGDPPSHPQLLDWLAVEFVDSGWDRKHLIKTIMMSATYQQSARKRRE